MAAQHNEASPRSLLLRVYGDSLGMPRGQEGVTPEDTYAERFRESLCASRRSRVMLYNRSRGGATVDVLRRDFLADAAYFGKGARGVLVLQCGIVDCAPRPIPRWFRSVLSRLHGRARAPIVRWLHNNRRWLLRFGLSWRLTPPRRFEEEIGKWLEDAASQVDEIYVVTIAPTTPQVEAHSPGLGASIVTYNQLLRDVVKRFQAQSVAQGMRIVLVDIHETIRESGAPIDRFVCPSDGHHITVAGHALYASQLIAAEAGGEPRTRQHPGAIAVSMDHADENHAGEPIPY